jgi:hypothetical protein
MLKRAAILVSLVGLFAQSPVSAGEIKVPATLLSAIANKLVQGSQLHLNNLGSKRGKSWHKPNDSFLRLSPQFGAAEFRFDLPEKTVKLDCGILCPSVGTGRFYVNDWNLERTEISWQRSQFRLSLFFESEGREIKGFHTGLISLRDGGVPDAEINQARLEIDIKPVVEKGRLSYLVTSTKFNASIQATGACKIFGLDICNALFKYRHELTSQVAAQVQNQLNDPSVRDRVTEAIQPALAQLGIGTITELKLNEENWVIRYTDPG